MKRTKEPVKLIQRFPYHPQVNIFSHTMGTLYQHLRVYSKPEQVQVAHAFRRTNQILYDKLKAELLAAKPRSDSSKEEILRFNDSVHHMKVMYTRNINKVTTKAWLST